MEDTLDSALGSLNIGAAPDVPKEISKIKSEEPLQQSSYIEEPSRLKAASAAVRETWLGAVPAYVIDGVHSLTFDRDTTFNIEDKYDDMMQSGISSSQFNYIEETARNEEHYRILLGTAKREKENANNLDSLGVEGLLYRLGGAIIEVAAVPELLPAKMMGGFDKALGVVDGVSKAMGLSSKAAGVLTKVSTGVGVELGFELMRQQNKISESDESDFIIAGLGGAVGGSLYRPSKLTKEVSDRFSTRVNEDLEDMADIIDSTLAPNAKQQLIEQAKHKKIASMLEATQLDQYSFLANTQSKTLNGLVPKLLHSARVMGTDDYSATEVASLIDDNIALKVKDTFKKFYDEWYVDMGHTKFGTNKLSRYDVDRQDELSDFIGKVAVGVIDETTNPELVKHISRARQVIGEVAEHSHDVLTKQGHRLFAEGLVEKDPNWFMRRWSGNKFLNAHAAGKATFAEMGELFTQGLIKGLERAGREVTPDMIENTIKPKAERFIERQKAAKATTKDRDFANEISIDNRINNITDEFNELLEMFPEGIITKEGAGSLLKEATDVVKGTSKAADPLASSAKRRNAIDMTVSMVTKSGNNISLNDFVDTDFVKQYLGYAKQMGGDTALQKLGITSRGNLAEIVNKVEKELIETHGVGLKTNMAVNNLKDVFKQMLGMPSATDPNGLGMTLATNANMLTRTFKLGSVGISMVTEFVKTVHSVGVPSFVKSMPEIVNIIRGAGSEAHNELRSLLSLSQFNNLPMSSVYEELGTFKGGTKVKESFLNNPTSYINNTIKPKISGAWELTQMAGGMKPLTTLYENMFAAGTQNKVLTHVLNNKQLDPRIAREFGWSQETFERIADNIRRYSDKTNNGTGDLMNFDMWDDVVANQYAMGLRRLSKVVVQRGEIGDGLGIIMGGVPFAETASGKLTLALKDYAIKAYSRQFSRAVYNFDSRILAEWIAGAGGAYLVTVAKAHVSAGGDEDKLEKNLASDKIIAGTVQNFPASSIIPMFLNSYSQALTGQPLTEQAGSRGNTSGLTPPAIAMAGNIAKLPSIGMGLALDGVNVSADKLAKGIRTMIPNFYGVSYLAHGVGQTFGEEDEDEAAEESNVVTTGKATATLAAGVTALIGGKKVVDILKRGK